MDVAEALAELDAVAAGTDTVGGNSFATATEITAEEIASGYSKTVNISTAGEVKYFKITPSETAYYVFTSSNNVKSSDGSSKLDTYATLYDSDKGEITYNDDGAGDRLFYFVSNDIWLLSGIRF